MKWSCQACPTLSKGKSDFLSPSWWKKMVIIDYISYYLFIQNTLSEHSIQTIILSILRNKGKKLSWMQFSSSSVYDWLIRMDRQLNSKVIGSLFSVGVWYGMQMWWRDWLYIVQKKLSGRWYFRETWNVGRIHPLDKVG